MSVVVVIVEGRSPPGGTAVHLEDLIKRTHSDSRRPMCPLWLTEWSKWVLKVIAENRNSREKVSSHDTQSVRGSARLRQKHNFAEPLY